MAKLKLSLWLRPDDPACSLYRDQIVRLSSRDAGGSAPFEPHITLIGGIVCEEVHLADMMDNLQRKLEGFGSILCQFESTPYFAPVWHQAAVLGVKESHELVRLVRICKDAIEQYSGDPVSVFPPPIEKPHLSLFYGTANVPTANEIGQAVPDCWTASRVELWSTNPSSVEGVRQWKMIHFVKLT